MNRSEHFEQKRQEVHHNADAALRKLEREEQLTLLMPDPIDERLPRVYVSTIVNLGYDGTIKWGGSFRTEEKFTDEEVVRLMELYPPLPMVYAEIMGSTAFRPFEHEQAWHELWHEREVPQKNGTVNVFTPVSPFRFKMYLASHSDLSITVEWFTRLGDSVMASVVHLDPRVDAAHVEYKAGVGNRAGRPERFQPVIGGNWSFINRWTHGPSDLKTTYYWPHPEEEDRTWKSVIDYVYRDIHKEKQRERE